MDAAMALMWCGGVPCSLVLYALDRTYAESHPGLKSFLQWVRGKLSCAVLCMDRWEKHKGVLGIAFCSLTLATGGFIGLLVAPLVLLVMAVVSSWTVVPFMLLGGLDEELAVELSTPRVPARRPERAPTCKDRMAFALVRSRCYRWLEPVCFSMCTLVPLGSAALSAVAIFTTAPLVFIANDPVESVVIAALVVAALVYYRRRRVRAPEAEVALVQEADGQAEQPALATWTPRLAVGRIVAVVLFTAATAAGLYLVSRRSDPVVRSIMAHVSAVKEDMPTLDLGTGSRVFLTGAALGAATTAAAFGVFCCLQLRRARQASAARSVELEDGRRSPLVL